MTTPIKLSKSNLAGLMQAAAKAMGHNNEGRTMTTDNQSLPPLPEPTCFHSSVYVGSGNGYTTDQMYEYGDARSAHARKEVLEDVVKCVETNWLATNGDLVKKIKELK